ncbi:hypothetical protein CC86DRAFT_364927 [Ophiobolus disseminans]|uniref:Uncharacterized protein n=1 Tax=Ophiobolus disseminans TaxID=1469910 RepID=A0A6A7AIZ1_9PLEO|nr:hypothetical protein CC86DRAFT_364927 [Ophiobolus disseminans]
MLAAPLSLSLLFAFPLTGILFIPEVKYTLQNSTTYQAFFGRNQTAVQGQTNSTNSDLRHDDASGFGISGNKPSIYQKIYAKIGMCQRTLRFICALPKQRRGGVRLITPVDIMHRR